MDEISLVARALFKIRDHVTRRVVRGNAVRERKVALPHVNNPRRLRQSQVVVLFVWSGRYAGSANWFHLIVRHTETLSGSVIDDDHLRPDRAEKRRGAGVVERAMTIDCIDCYRADLIHRTNEFELTLPVEIAQARKLEVAVCEREP